MNTNRPKRSKPDRKLYPKAGRPGGGKSKSFQRNRPPETPRPAPPAPRKRKRISLPIRGLRPEAPAWIGRLDHPFKVEQQRVAELLTLLGINDPDESPFFHHLDLVKTLNDQVNLVSRANVDAVLLQSLWESLIPAKHDDWRRGSRLLDLGTGGGFPGLPLAFALPDLKVTLLDSRRAKTLSLQRMLIELKTTTIQIIHDRAEIHAERLEQPYDSITVRAVSVLPEVAGWCEKLLRPGGTLLSWKGPEGQREAKALDPVKWTLLHAYPILPHRYVLVLEFRGTGENANDDAATLE